MYQVNSDANLLKRDQQLIGSDFENTDGKKVRLETRHKQVVARKFFRKRIAVGNVVSRKDIPIKIFQSKIQVPVKLNRVRIRNDGQEHEHQKPEFEISVIKERYM